MPDVKKIAETHLHDLSSNVYPGRGIVQGMTEDGKNLVQIYWIMGRSENSRNRIFIEEDGFVRTAPYDASKMKDPSLIIYYPVKKTGSSHIVSNGDQTDTVYENLQKGITFERALESRKFEPDSPNYTPRITGIIDRADPLYTYKFSVIRSFFNDPDFCERYIFAYERAIPGLGHCVHTYDDDGDVLPSFSAIPYIVPLHNDIDKTLSLYWQTLNEANRISLLVKYIGSETGDVTIRIKNRY